MWKVNYYETDYKGRRVAFHEYYFDEKYYAEMHYAKKRTNMYCEKVQLKACTHNTAKASGQAVLYE